MMRRLVLYHLLVPSLVVQGLRRGPQSAQARPDNDDTTNDEVTCKLEEQVFLTSHRGEHLTNTMPMVVGLSSDTGDYQKWTIADAEEGELYLTSFRNRHLGVNLGIVHTNGWRGVNEKWTMSSAGEGKVFITSRFGKQLEDRDGSLKFTSDKGESQAWTITTMTGEVACDTPFRGTTPAPSPRPTSAPQPTPSEPTTSEPTPQPTPSEPTTSEPTTPAPTTAPAPPPRRRYWTRRRTRRRAPTPAPTTTPAPPPRRRYWTRRRTRRRAPTPAPTPVPTPGPTGECTLPLPDWLYTRVAKIVDDTIATALAMADPLPLELRDTQMEQNLLFCTLTVNASTTNTISGMSGGSIQGMQCLNNVCEEEDSDKNCIKNKVTLGSKLSFPTMHGEGTDRSIWTCNDELPLREVHFSYDIVDTVFALQLELEITYEGMMRTPTAKILELSDINTKVGTVDNHHCEHASGFNPILIDPALKMFCKPMLNLAVGFFRNLYFPIVDKSLSVLVNAIVKPKDDEMSGRDSSWNTAALMDMAIKYGAYTIAGCLACCCLCCTVMMRRRQPGEPREVIRIVHVPVVEGESLNQGSAITSSSQQTEDSLASRGFFSSPFSAPSAPAPTS